MGKIIKMLEEEVAKKKKKSLQATILTRLKKCFFTKSTIFFSVLDFWRYAYSQLENLSDTLAEFLVAKSLEIEKADKYYEKL